jgi:hypothetical protein
MGGEPGQGPGRKKGVIRPGPSAHATHVEHLLYVGRWVAYCDLCGQIGEAHRLEGDAWAVADRHRDIGGFG